MINLVKFVNLILSVDLDILIQREMQVIFEIK